MDNQEEYQTDSCEHNEVFRCAECCENDKKLDNELKLLSKKIKKDTDELDSLFNVRI